MKTGCNLFVTKENVGYFDRLVADLLHASMQQIIPEVYYFTPNARGRHSDPLQPECQDVQPLGEIIDDIPETCLWRRYWQEHQRTESWYVRQALEGTWQAPPEGRRIALVCRPTLDVYRGVAGQYTRRYGNLRRDGVDWVLSRTIRDGAWSDDEIWFAPEQLLPVQELAAHWGNAQSQRIHMGPDSIRHWWLDCARRAGRVS